MSDEKEFIEAVRREREEEVRFFSNAAKPERERWVVFAPGEPRNTVLSNVNLLMLETAISSRYPSMLKAKLDLLFYITRSHSGLGSEDERYQLAAAGWRSISCLYGSRPLLLAATGDAPAFLQCERIGG